MAKFPQPFYHWRPHPWHGLEVGNKPPHLVHAYITDIADLPQALIDRLRHYFGTYELVPGQEPQFSIEETYGRDNALRVVEAAIEDYENEYGQQVGRYSAASSNWRANSSACTSPI